MFRVIFSRTLAALRYDNAELHANLRNAAAFAEDLEADRDRLIDALDAERDESRRLGEALDARSKDLARADYDLDRAARALGDARDEYKERSRQLSAANDSILNLREVIRRDGEELAGQAERIEALEAERDAARADLEEAAQEAVTGRNRIAYLEDRIEELHAALGRAGQERDALEEFTARAIGDRDKARALLVETLEQRFELEARADRFATRARELSAELDAARYRPEPDAPDGSYIPFDQYAPA